MDCRCHYSLIEGSRILSKEEFLAKIKIKEKEKAKETQAILEETKVIKNLTQLKEEINREFKVKMKVEGNEVELGFSDKKTRFLLKHSKTSPDCFLFVLNKAVLFLNIIKSKVQHVPSSEVLTKRKLLIESYIERGRLCC